jgi:hypothetical protein
MRKATPTPVTPEMERAKRNQENISSVFSRIKKESCNNLENNILTSKKCAFLIQLKNALKLKKR